jgi:hypothetical protein
MTFSTRPRRRAAVSGLSCQIGLSTESTSSVSTSPTGTL